MSSEISFPLKLSQFLSTKNLTNFFPARHGRVSFTSDRGSTPSTWSPSFRRFLSSIHYEFCEFHRRINEPLESAGVSPESILGDYATGLVCRVEKAKQVCPETDSSEDEFAQLSRAGLLLELAQICLVDSALGACKFPRLLIRHGGVNLEKIVHESETFLNQVQEDDGLISDKSMEKLFWENMKKLALLDVTPVIASLIGKYLSLVNFRRNKHSLVCEYSASLLLAFYNEVPSLYDLAASLTTSVAPVDQLEKRRAYASVALHKDVTGGEVSQFFWKLNIADEADYAIIRSAILDLQLFRISPDAPGDLTWYEKLGLVWCWLHVVDEPGEALSFIAKDVAAGSDFHSTNVSVFDACIFAIFTKDLISLFSLIVQEKSEFGGFWFSAIVSDLIFYTGADGGDVLGKLRDRLLMEYCRDLMALSGLGTRIACDIVVTLGERSAFRGSEETLSRLAAVESTAAIGRTRQWLLAVKLSHDNNVGTNLTESLCLEKFQADSRNARVVDAIQALAVAAEVGKDVHAGACRISDYLDGENVREKFHGASVASLGILPSTGLLPEYIDSGRFRFFANLENLGDSSEVRISSLIRLVTSPDCPPESVIGLVTEIRHGLTQAQKSNKDIHLGLEEGIALSKALIDVATSSGTTNAPEEVLMSWIADEMMHSALIATE